MKKFINKFSTQAEALAAENIYSPQTALVNGEMIMANIGQNVPCQFKIENNKLVIAERAEPEEPNLTILFTSNNIWNINDICLYMWDKNNQLLAGPWPGIHATGKYMNDFGHWVAVFVFDEIDITTIHGIIFSSNGQQTDDIVVDLTSNKFGAYLTGTTQNGKYNAETWIPTEIPPYTNL